jgi:hypothetical protein
MAEIEKLEKTIATSMPNSPKKKTSDGKLILRSHKNSAVNSFHSGRINSKIEKR